MRRLLQGGLLAALVAGMAFAASAAENFDAAAATNQIGLDLFRRMAAGGKENLVISPYSIESALALAYVGAAGDTRTEMAKVLHFPAANDSLASGLNSLSSSLEASAGDGKLEVANRLFGQAGYPFLPTFLQMENDQFGAGFGPMDFQHDPGGSAAAINQWIAGKTENLIQNAVGQLDPATRLVLVDALYFRGNWADPFEKEATKPAPFHLESGGTKTVPLMQEMKFLAEAEKPRWQVLYLPYNGDLGMALFLPRAGVPLAEVIGGLQPSDLQAVPQMRRAEVDLFLPRFRVEGNALALGEPLRDLGLRRAFDDPRGSADFSQAAPRRPDDYLYLSQVFHKTYVSVDETGTEAAAVTGDVLLSSFGMARDIIEFRADRPFVFAILDHKTGVCLFLGAMTDP